MDAADYERRLADCEERIAVYERGVDDLLTYIDQKMRDITDRQDREIPDTYRSGEIQGVLGYLYGALNQAFEDRLTELELMRERVLTIFRPDG